MIALSCGIKISAVRHLVLSQCTRVTDGQTDRITTPKTALAYARAVKSVEKYGKITRLSKVHQKFPTAPEIRFETETITLLKGKNVKIDFCDSFL